MAITKVTTPVTGFESPVDIGLKIPVGTNSNLPTGLEGMIRNDTDENSGGSGSTTAITHYNGSDWRYFSSTVSTTPSENFNTVLYTGNGSTQTFNVGTVGFQPDLVWLKQRTGSNANHLVADTVRGPWKIINPNLAFQTVDRTSVDKTITSFADGFTVKDTANGDYECNGTNGGTYSGNGTYVAWCLKADGLANRSADFNGSSSIIKSTALGIAFRSQTTLSISAWFKTSQSTRLTIASFSNTTVGSTDLWLGSSTSGDTISFRNVNNGTNSLQFNNAGGLSVRDGNWHHVVFTADSSGTRIYVDDSELTGFTYQFGDEFTPIVMPTSLNQFSIGANQDISAPGGQWFLNGQINQVRVFTSALSGLQVTELYNETKADNSVLNYPTGAGCIAAYPLGENANSLNSAYNGTASNVTFGLPGYLTRNNNGTIESTVSVNNNLGFSIVSYTGVGGSLKTIGHGLNAAPEMIIVKSTSNNDQWWVWHKDLTSIDYYLILSGINPETYYANNEGLFGRTLPTPLVFSVGYASETNGSGRQYISYCFTSKPGFSKVGSYTGNGGNNPVDVGFEPAFVMIKKSTTSNASWAMFDNKRTTANPSTSALYANEAINEEDLQLYFEFTSTGFKNLQSSNTLNTSGSKYIYLAFAN